MDIITFDLETTWREIRNQLEKPPEGIGAYLEVAASQAKWWGKDISPAELERLMAAFRGAMEVIFAGAHNLIFQ